VRDVIGNKAVQFRPYCGGVVTRTRNVSEDMLVPALCLVLTVYTELRIVNKTGGILYCNANTGVEYVACSACVSMGERNRCMGASAKNQLITNIKNTVWGWKKLIGRKFNERVVQNEIPHFTYEVVESKDGAIGIQVCYLEVALIATIFRL